MEISFVQAEIPLRQDQALVVAALAGQHLTPSAVDLDKMSEGRLTRAMAYSRFSGKKGQSLVIHAPSGVEAPVILLIGLGSAESLDTLATQEMGGHIVAALEAQGIASACLNLARPEDASIAPAEWPLALALGASLRKLRFDKYRTRVDEDKKPTLVELSITCSDSRSTQTAFKRHQAVCEGVALARILASEPGNVIYPKTLADMASSLAHDGVEIEVLGPSEMSKLGMNALLAVGRGSARDPRLVIMRSRGHSHHKTAPVAFVGKGVTFDTGGISIKPSASMEDMKWDMSGAAAVVGLMKTLALRRAPIDAIGVIGCVENMPDGDAQRPGDIITSLSGRTIEVLNTDAEGRLVLADALWYTYDRFKPRIMIDLATLTGAIVSALGHDMAGLFTNNDLLAESLATAGAAVGEPVWRLPITEAVEKDMESEIADLRNIGSDRAAGAAQGAAFLKHFIGETQWAHLDIAGIAWTKKDSALVPKGATGFGVRLLDRFVDDLASA